MWFIEGGNKHLAFECNVASPLHHLGVKAQPLCHGQGIGQAPLPPQQPVRGLQGGQIKLHTCVDEARVRCLQPHTAEIQMLNST